MPERTLRIMVLLLAILALPAVALGQSRVFVSSSRSLGVGFGGLAGADQICNSLAAGQGLGGTWVAWLSDETTDAVARLADVGPWVRLDSVQVADDLADLTDGDIDNPISVDEMGNLVEFNHVWTGTLGTGLADNGFTCDSWMPGAAGMGRTGNTSSTSDAWTHAGSAICDWPTPTPPGEALNRLYCFETLSTTVIPIPALSGVGGVAFALALAVSALWMLHWVRLEP